MAGDWIQMRHDLFDDPAVIGIAERLNINESYVIGMLHKFWSWGDRQTLDGHAPSVTIKWLDRYVQCDGFALSMVQVGWLELEGGSSCTSNAGIIIPKFDTYISESAKKRALSARRQRKKRNAPSVTNVTHGALLCALPREEKRREEIIPPTPFSKELPQGFNTSQVKEAFSRWFAYLNSKGKPTLDHHAAAVAAVGFFRTPCHLITNIDYAIANGYLGLKNYPDAVKPKRDKELERL